MGSLTRYALRNIGCSIFFETGVGYGASLRHVLNTCKFKKIYSTEIDEATAQAATEKFKSHSNVLIINKSSEDAIRELLPKIPADENIMFFLDAHFPGEYSEAFEGYSNVNPNEISLPLKTELKLIHSIRGDSNDLILIDDLRLYEDGPYENGNITKNFGNIPERERNLDFVNTLYKEKVIERDYRDEGYLIIRPSESEFKLDELSTFFRTKRSLRKNIKKYLKV